VGTYNKILVSTDFSDISIRAFFSAVDLASQLGATLQVIHIVQIPPLNTPASGNENIEALEAEEERMAKESMQKLIQQAGQDLEITTRIVHGNPVAQIESMAKEIHADLIVMGTHGRTGMSHLIMGSVAESVIRNSEVPVMCVKGI